VAKHHKGKALEVHFANRITFPPNGFSEKAAPPPHSSAGSPMDRTGSVFSYPSAPWQSEASDGNKACKVAWLLLQFCQQLRGDREAGPACGDPSASAATSDPIFTY
jgi:hypothetical protein